MGIDLVTIFIICSSIDLLHLLLMRRLKYFLQQLTNNMQWIFVLADASHSLCFDGTPTFRKYAENFRCHLF